MKGFAINRRFIGHFDWALLLIVLALTCTGVFTIYSATRPLPGGGAHPNFYMRQIYWLGVGLIAMLATVRVDYKWFGRFAAPLYVIGIVLLLIVLVLGKKTMGAQRWLSIGPLSFQPSELFRLLFVIAIAKYLSLFKGDVDLRTMLKAFSVLALLPFLVLLKQPDLGTAGILMLLFLGVAFMKGIERKLLALMLALSIVSVPFLGGIFWGGLKDYQKNRIIAFVKPDVDPTGIGYHISQSKVAIGSGGLIGKGYMAGTQGPFRFLPEKHTDFVFSVFAEEWGFAGSILLLFLYLLLLLRGLDTARIAKDAFGQLLAAGITLMFAYYIFFNIGMTMGILPVVGIPLPFMSYGGSALVVNFAAVGLLINIRARRFELFY